MSLTKRLISNSLIIFVGTFFGGIFSYLYNMLMGRMLEPVAYGELTALMSLMMIVSVAGGAIFTITMRYSGELSAGKKFQALNKLFKFVSKYVLILGLLIFAVGSLLSRPIANFLSVESLVPVVISLSSVVLGLLLLVNKGFLQGLQRFYAITLLGSGEMLLRLILGVALVSFGFSLNGAIAALVLASGLMYAVSFWPYRKALVLDCPSSSENSFKFDKKEIVSYSWPTLVSAILLVVATNLDIIVIKHFFDPHSAGVYAAISTIAKIILYATGPIVGVMFPMVSEQKTKGEKHYKVFLFSILATIMIGFVILAVYNIIPGRIISLLYGNAYIEYYNLLPEIGLAIAFFSLFNLIANYFLAIKNFIFLWFIGAVLLFQTLILFVWHPSILAIVRVFIFSYGLIFALMFGYYLISKKDSIAQYLKGEFEGSDE